MPCSALIEPPRSWTRSQTASVDALARRREAGIVVRQHEVEVQIAVADMAEGSRRAPGSQRRDSGGAALDQLGDPRDRHRDVVRDDRPSTRCASAHAPRASATASAAAPRWRRWWRPGSARPRTRRRASLGGSARGHPAATRRARPAGTRESVDSAGRARPARCAQPRRRRSRAAISSKLVISSANRSCGARQQRRPPPRARRCRRSKVTRSRGPREQAAGKRR